MESFWVEQREDFFDFRFAIFDLNFRPDAIENRKSQI